MMGPYTSYIIAAFGITGFVFAFNILHSFLEGSRIKKTIQQKIYER